jgi:hypothetical protein
VCVREGRPPVTSIPRHTLTLSVQLYVESWSSLADSDGRSEWSNEAVGLRVGSVGWVREDSDVCLDLFDLS